MKGPSSNNPAGRPRSADVTDRLHQAVWRLLEFGRWDDLTMERISEEAKVSRPALYRRYTSQGQVVLGALLAFGSSDLTMAYSPCLKSDLQAYFKAVVGSVNETGAVGKALRGVLSQALVDETFAGDFQAFISHRREPVRRRIATGRPECSDGQVEAAVDALFGPVLYRLLIRGVSVSELTLVDLIELAIQSGGLTHKR